MRLPSLALSLFLFMVGCSSHDEAYYRLHPKQLQQVLKQCTGQASTNENCEQLKILAAQMTQLAYELQKNPQAFGNQILSLQEKIAEVDTQPHSNKETLKSLHKELQDRLAIIKWLESPENY